MGTKRAHLRRPDPGLELDVAFDTVAVLVADGDRATEPVGLRGELAKSALVGFVPGGQGLVVRLDLATGLVNITDGGLFAFA